jgi:SRSO17 transposase
MRIRCISDQARNCSLSERENSKQSGLNSSWESADSLYGESDSNFISVLCKLQLDFVVAIRSNYGVWLPQGQKVRYNRWRPYNRIFSDGKQEKR